MENNKIDGSRKTSRFGNRARSKAAEKTAPFRSGRLLAAAFLSVLLIFSFVVFAQDDLTTAADKTDALAFILDLESAKMEITKAQISISAVADFYEKQGDERAEIYRDSYNDLDSVKTQIDRIKDTAATSEDFINTRSDLISELKIVKANIITVKNKLSQKVVQQVPSDEIKEMISSADKRMAPLTQDDMKYIESKIQSQNVRTIEGRLAVFVVDSFTEGKSKNFYYLQTYENGKLKNYRLISKSSLPAISGAEMVVSGAKVGEDIIFAKSAIKSGKIEKRFESSNTITGAVASGDVPPGGYSCDPIYKTGPWGECVNGIRTRTVTLQNDCDRVGNKPSTTSACVECTPNKCYNQNKKCDSSGNSVWCPSTTPYCYDTPAPNTCDVERRNECTPVGKKECVNSNTRRECKFNSQLGQNYWETTSGASNQVCVNGEFMYRCSDGTAPSSCSTTKPKYCTKVGENMVLVDDCTKCGCSNTATQGCYAADKSCRPLAGNYCTGWEAEPADPGPDSIGTSFITPENSCAVVKPRYCSSGSYQAKKASVCGCPSPSVPNTFFSGEGDICVKKYEECDGLFCSDHKDVYYKLCNDGTLPEECSRINGGKICDKAAVTTNYEDYLHYRYYYNKGQNYAVYVPLRDNAACNYLRNICREGNPDTPIGQCSTDPRYVGTKCVVEDNSPKLLDTCDECGNRCSSGLTCGLTGDKKGLCYDPNDRTKPTFVSLPGNNEKFNGPVQISPILDDNKRLRKVEFKLNNNPASIKRITGTSDFTTFTSTNTLAGSNTLESKVYDTNGNSYTQSITFDVIKCSDGTTPGSCNLNNQYCDAKAQLVDDCTRCGFCGLDQVCSPYNGECLDVKWTNPEDEQPFTLGPQRTIVLSVFFNNVPELTYTKEELKTMFFDQQNEFFKTVSYGKSWITGPGDFLSMPKAGTINDIYILPQQVEVDITCDDVGKVFLAMSEAIEEVLKSFNLDPLIDKTDRIILVSGNTNPPCKWAEGIASGGKAAFYFEKIKEQYNISVAWIMTDYETGKIVPLTVAHELAHNIGFMESPALECGSESIQGTMDFCELAYYADGYNVMGIGRNFNPTEDVRLYMTPHFNAPQKNIAKWFVNDTFTDETSLITVGTADYPFGNVYRIYPIESQDKTKPRAIRFLRTETGGINPADTHPTYIYIEYRRPLDYDKNFAEKGYDIDGALMYLGKNNIYDAIQIEHYQLGPVYMNSLLLDGSPHTNPINCDKNIDFFETTCWKEQATDAASAVLKVGKRFTDPIAGGHTIEVVAATNEYLYVYIS